MNKGLRESIRIPYNQRRNWNEKHHAQTEHPFNTPPVCHGNGIVAKVTGINLSSFKIANIVSLALGSTQMTFLHLLRCGGLESPLPLPREYYLVLRVWISEQIITAHLQFRSQFSIQGWSSSICTQGSIISHHGVASPTQCFAQQSTSSCSCSDWYYFVAK